MTTTHKAHSRHLLRAERGFVAAAASSGEAGLLRALAAVGRAARLELAARCVVRAGEAPVVKVGKPTPGNHAHAAEAVLRLARLKAVGNWISKELADRLRGAEVDLVACLRAHDPTKGDDSAGNCFKDAQQRLAARFADIGTWLDATVADVQAAAADKAAAGVTAHHGVAVDKDALVGGPGLLVLGAPLEEHLALLRDQLLFRFRATVRQGLKAGDDLDGLVARVEGTDAGAVQASAAVRAAVSDTATQILVRLLDPTENSIDKVIDAAVTAIADDASKRALAGVEDVLEGGGAAAVPALGWQWVSVLDANTCPECEALDGGRWTQDGEPVGDTALEMPEEPPLHFGCRCAMVPTDLGEEAAPQQTFEEYLSQFSRSEQEEAFGKANLRAYQRGDISAANLIKQPNRLVTLEQFKTGGGK